MTTSDNSHELEVASVLGHHSDPAGVSGTTVRMVATADEKKLGGFTVTVAHDVAHLFEEGAKWVLRRK